jgi:hypothetical protein
MIKEKRKMKQIRNNVFETNSSSTHSICISKKPVSADGSFIHFYIGEYGWGHDCVSTSGYLYTAILCMGDSEYLLGKLKAILDRHQITYEFEEPDYAEDGWLKYGYIDHSDDAREFIEGVLASDDMLMRCLFGDSWVYTGNDNDAEPDSMCYAAEPTTWDSSYNSIPNPNHDPENYDYFFKGN